MMSVNNPTPSLSGPTSIAIGPSIPYALNSVTVTAAAPNSAKIQSSIFSSNEVVSTTNSLTAKDLIPTVVKKHMNTVAGSVCNTSSNSKLHTNMVNVNSNVKACGTHRLYVRPITPGPLPPPKPSPFVTSTSDHPQRMQSPKMAIAKVTKKQTLTPIPVHMNNQAFGASQPKTVHQITSSTSTSKSIIPFSRPPLVVRPKIGQIYTNQHQLDGIKRSNNVIQQPTSTINISIPTRSLPQHDSLNSKLPSSNNIKHSITLTSSSNPKIPKMSTTPTITARPINLQTSAATPFNFAASVNRILTVSTSTVPVAKVLTPNSSTRISRNNFGNETSMRSSVITITPNSSSNLTKTPINQKITFSNQVLNPSQSLHNVSGDQRNQQQPVATHANHNIASKNIVPAILRRSAHKHPSTADLIAAPTSKARFPSNTNQLDTQVTAVKTVTIGKQIAPTNGITSIPKKVSVDREGCSSIYNNNPEIKPRNETVTSRAKAETASSNLAQKHLVYQQHQHSLNKEFVNESSSQQQPLHPLSSSSNISCPIPVQCPTSTHLPPTSLTKQSATSMMSQTPPLIKTEPNLPPSNQQLYETPSRPSLKRDHDVAQPSSFSSFEYSPRKKPRKQTHVIAPDIHDDEMTDDADESVDAMVYVGNNNARPEKLTQPTTEVAEQKLALIPVSEIKIEVKELAASNEASSSSSGEFVDSEGVRYLPFRKRAPFKIMSGLRQKSLNNHFVRRSELKIKTEKKICLSDACYDESRFDLYKIGMLSLQFKSMIASEAEYSNKLQRIHDRFVTCCDVIANDGKHLDPWEVAVGYGCMATNASCDKDSTVNPPAASSSKNHKFGFTKQPYVVQGAIATDIQTVPAVRMATFDPIKSFHEPFASSTLRSDSCKRQTLIKLNEKILANMQRCQAAQHQLQESLQTVVRTMQSRELAVRVIAAVRSKQKTINKINGTGSGGGVPRNTKKKKFF